MSIYFCHGCQQNRDGDVDGINSIGDKDFCELCWCSKNCHKISKDDTEIEKIAKQTDGNSLNLMDLDERVSKLEGKD